MFAHNNVGDMELKGFSLEDILLLSSNNLTFWYNLKPLIMPRIT